MKRVLMVFLLLAAATTTFGKSEPLPTGLVAEIVGPDTGMFYDPSEPGSGLMLQRLGDGRYFGIYATYDPSGEPSWVSFGGAFEAAADVVTAASVGGIEGTVIEHRGGSCHACTYQPANAVDTADPIVLTFQSPSRAIVTYQGVSRTMDAANSTTSKLAAGGDQRRLTGQWDTTIRVPDASGVMQTHRGKVEFFAVPLNNLRDRDVPAQGRYVYGVLCLGTAMCEHAYPRLGATSPQTNGLDLRRLIFEWDANSRSGALKTYSIDALPTGTWVEVADAASGTLNLSGLRLSGLIAVGSGTNRVTGTIEMVFEWPWFGLPPAQ